MKRIHYSSGAILFISVTIAFDSDPNEAAAVRATLLDRVATDKLSISGMHFNLPASGRIYRENNQYVLNYDAWSPAV